ncbi:MAG: thiosulfate dehydrogenase (quinone) large subunit [Thermoleophilaceae bacterium]|nr:thiosulfate dehydrogenase (quinone) large subunit [Thermoleophilaceae bacterium]
MRNALNERVQPGLALLPLRLFLGVTFIYAGVQKLSDPGYLNAGAPTYIGTQLQGFAHGTPGGFLLRTFAIPHAELAGVATALLEIGVGVVVTAGLFTRFAALVGLLLNLVLFLTNSWNAYPYFLGSDIVFVFAWLPFVLAGAEGQPAVDNELERLRRSDRMRWSPGVQGGQAPPLSRREVLVRALGLAGAATLGVGALSALAKGTYRAQRSKLAARRSAPTAAPKAAQTPAPQAASKVPANAVKQGPSTRPPAGQGATYTDPSDGSPDIVIRNQAGKLVAFSAVCTHAGCTVGYQGGQIVCPCHGGTFDASSGAVISGPPQQGLAQRRVIETGGDIYALRA